MNLNKLDKYLNVSKNTIMNEVKNEDGCFFDLLQYCVT